MPPSALPHVEHFANTLGPRGSATPQEKAAHDYCQATLEALGYTVRRDEFLSVTSGWRPFTLALGLMLLAVLVFVGIGRGPNAQTGALAAAALGLVVVVSFFLHVTHRPSPLTWLLPLEGGIAYDHVSTTGFEAGAAQEGVAAQWREKLDQVRIEVPSQGQALADTLRTATAHMLISRIGPRLQPGTRSYARSWIRDGAMISEGLLRMGREEVVRDYVEFYAPYQF